MTAAPAFRAAAGLHDPCAGLWVRDSVEASQAGRAKNDRATAKYVDTATVSSNARMDSSNGSLHWKSCNSRLLQSSGDGALPSGGRAAVRICLGGGTCCHVTHYFGLSPRFSDKRSFVGVCRRFCAIGLSWQRDSAVGALESRGPNSRALHAANTAGRSSPPLCAFSAEIAAVQSPSRK